MDRLGFQDTPFLPGGQWHVHDGLRPQPPIVRPSPCPAASTPAPPPGDAIVLFAGGDLSEWVDLATGGPANWRVHDGCALVHGGSIRTRRHFGDCQLHVEWMPPSPPAGVGQDRGNSGVILMGFYEVQVLDSHGNPTYPDGQAGAIYGTHPPLVNAMRPPGEWQEFDIIFTAPRFDGDALRAPATMTVHHNGILVHNHVELLGRTAWRAVPAYSPHAPEGPLVLQDHGCEVRFRNIWIRRLRD